MKSSSSQLLKSIKGSYFNTLNTNEESHQGTYNKTKEKINMLEFELDRNRDIIIRLRAELANKNKEISLLKVNKNKKNEEYQKAMRVIEEILKQCDQSTTAGFNVIENSLANIELGNNNSGTQKSKKYKSQLPQIGDMLHFSSQHKKIMKEMVFVSMLKNQISNLNEELVKKDEKITELKKNQNSTNFSKLQNNFIKNFNELTQVKKENEFMKTRIEDVHHMLLAEKEENFYLKSKLQDFQEKYKFFKDTTVKKTNALETMLEKMKTKQRDCKIFHIRKGTSASAIRAIERDRGPGIGIKKENDGGGDNDTSKNNLNEEIKKMSKTMSQLKISQNNKDNEIKLLKKENQDYINKINKLESDINQLIQKNELLNKQLQDSNNKRKSVEKNIKDQAIDANKIIENLEKENQELNDKIKNMTNDLRIKESLIEEEKSRTKALEEENKELNKKIAELDKKIAELEKKIEELQNELINYKDDMFLTNVGIRKTPHNMDKNNNDNNELKIEEENNLDKKEKNNDFKDLDVFEKENNDEIKEEEKKEIDKKI